MNRNVSVAVLTALLTLAVVFSFVVWLTVHTSQTPAPTSARYPGSEHHSGRREDWESREEHEASRHEPRRNHEQPGPLSARNDRNNWNAQDARSEAAPGSCATLGIRCDTQYLAAWSLPAAGSCRTHEHNGYPEPDPRCTPGGVVPGLTADTLRDPAWSTRCVRNCQSTEKQKHATYDWYALPPPAENSGETQTCELDHLVPLELGGADGMGNIWPQCGPEDVALRDRFFKQKDIVENYLAAKVRAGEIPLEEAQRGIAADWVQYLETAKAFCHGSRC